MRIWSSLFLVSSSCPHEDIFDAADSYTKRLLPFWLVRAGSRDLGCVIGGRDRRHVSALHEVDDQHGSIEATVASQIHGLARR